MIKIGSIVRAKTGKNMGILTVESLAELKVLSASVNVDIALCHSRYGISVLPYLVSDLVEILPIKVIRK